MDCHRPNAPFRPAAVLAVVVVDGQVPVIEHLLVVHAEAAVHQGAAVQSGRAVHHDDRRHPAPPKRIEDAPGGLLLVASGSANALRDDAHPSTGAPEADGPAATVREDDLPPPTALAQRRSAACRAAPVMTEEVVMGRRGCGGQARGSKTTRGQRNIGWRRTMPPKDVAVVLVTVIATS